MSENINKIEEYRSYLDKAMSYYYDDLLFLKHFNKIPKSRYHSFKQALNYIVENNLTDILELGTSRSFVDGRFEGCNSDDTKYWEPENPEKWDWSAGLFTRVFGESLAGTSAKITTVDCIKSHLDRCKIITESLDNIEYVCMRSEEFLKTCDRKYDVIYLDTGDMTPIEDVAILQLLEAHLIVSYEILNDNGIIILDDVMNPLPKMDGEENNYGKSKYSIQFFLDNDFEIIYHEYQVILKKKKS